MSVKTLCLILLLSAGCSSNPSGPSDVPLGREFTLKPGETASIQSAGLRVTFVKVASDSRCPADVVCVQAGDAAVDLMVGMTSVQLLSNRAPETTVGTHRIRLERVEPYVYTSKPIGARDYRAVLTVSQPVG